jgi:uroporphyrinogen decarboxylase
MSPKERIIAAFAFRPPDDIVATFEFSFALTQELSGRDFIDLGGLTGTALDRGIKQNAELHIEQAERLDWSVITESHPQVIRELVRMRADKTYLIAVKNGDRTYRIAGENADSMIAHFYDQPDEFKRQLEKDTDAVIEASKRLTDAGAACFVMGADYAGNRGPFLSPQMFAEFVQPYLHRTIEAHHQNGAYVIKHTDGDIMPIMNQILACGPDALHSIDPTAGMDIAEVKRLIGDKVCLIGNVDCAALVQHDSERIRQSARYALKHGMPGGGTFSPAAILSTDRCTRRITS